MTEPDGILDVLRQLQPLIDKANTLLSSEKMTLNHIRWGIEAKEKQLAKVREDISVEEMRLKSVKDSAEEIVHQANLEATRIKEKANADRMEAAKLKADLKLLIDETEKKKFMKKELVA